MAAARQTLGKKIFAGFAAVLLIAMTAIVPLLMDVREILVALGTQPGQFDANATPQAISPEMAQRVAGLAAHAYSYGAVGTALLVIGSMAIAYLITRAVNLPLFGIWNTLTLSLREVREVANAQPSAAYDQAELATKQLGVALGADDVGQGRQS